MGLKLTIQKLKELGIRGFMKKWLRGVQGITPLQSTKVSLWSFLPVIAGMIWGLVITFLAKTYWLSLILVGSLPLTIIQIISTYQRYVKLKQVEETLKQLNNDR